MNVHGFDDVRQIEIHTAEPVVHETSACLKGHKSPGIYQIQAELIRAGGRTIRSEIHKLTNSIWNKEELPEEWKESIIVPIDTKGDKTDCSS